eukprot:s7443_g1.t1
MPCSSSDDDPVEVIWLGVPREPDDFLAKAVLAGHPKALLDSVGLGVYDYEYDNLLDGQVMNPLKGKGELSRWSDLKRKLSQKQERERLKWDPHVRDVLGDKATVLLDALLQEFDFPDRRHVITEWGHPCHAVYVVPRPSREPIKEVARMARLKRLLDELVREPIKEVARMARLKRLLDELVRFPA